MADEANSIQAASERACPSRSGRLLSPSTGKTAPTLLDPVWGWPICEGCPDTGGVTGRRLQSWHNWEEQPWRTFKLLFLFKIQIISQLTIPMLFPNRKEWIFPSLWCWRHLALFLFTTWGMSGYWYSLVLLGFGIAHYCHNTRPVFWATEGQGLLSLFSAARVTSLLVSEKYLGKPLLLNEVFPLFFFFFPRRLCNCVL